MSAWTHLICERCYYDGDPRKVAYPNDPPGVMKDGLYRQASRVVDPDTQQSEPGACCFCGGFTVFGAYARMDPTKTMCAGDHDNPGAWSRVGQVLAP